MMNAMKENEKVSYGDVLCFAMHYWRRRPRAGLLLAVFMFTATLTDAFIPVYTGRIIDALVNRTATESGALGDALHYLVIFIGLGLGHTLLRSASSATWNWFSVNNLYDILTEATRKVQRFSSDWHANAFAGATVRKITRGMWAFDMFGDTLFIGLFPAVIIMMSMTAILLVHLPAVGMFTAAMIVIYCGTSTVISIKILRPRFQASASEDTKVGAALADMITGNATVKSFGAEEREDSLFHSVATGWKRLAYRAWMSAEAANLIRGILRITMMGGMVGLTIHMWRMGAATPGDIALSLTSFFIVSGYMRDVGMHIAHLQRSASEMEDVIVFWLRKDEMLDVPGAISFRAGAGEIVFDNVSFSYNEKVHIYDRFSLRIAPGERVALVGPSGSGKSTFVKLVQRLYDVQSGEIRIDGQNVAGVTQESLRRAIALVPQDPILFHRSLAANIAYGKPGVSMDEIIAAAKKAYAHDFISELPKGYETLVGERGVKLSGGERQRVAIARAILADAPILILDEATSSLDSISEHCIQKALKELMEGRTTITIAHRLATIRAVDRILVFENGRIVEEGAHDDLVDREGSHYRRLYEMQALDLIGEDYRVRAAE
ncbi:MAG: ABC transporter ATP-binding protein [Proteobacteria bacterium]|nr:ABC transporter ATP-binding protein [Pseudomonadota bacterium]